MDSDLLIKQLSTIRHRRFMLRLSEELTKWFFFGTIGVGTLVLIDHYVLRFSSYQSANITNQQSILLAIFALFFAICVGLIQAVRNRESLLDVAQFIDQKFDLKERVSTACELHYADAQQSIRKLQMEDAKETISSIDVHSEFPYKIPKFAKLLPISLTLVAVIFWQTGQPTPQTNLEREAIRQSVEELEKLVEPYNRNKRDAYPTKIELKISDDSNAETMQMELAKLHASVRNRKSTLQSELDKNLKQLSSWKDLPFNRTNVELKNLELRNVELKNELARLDKISKAIQVGQQRIGLTGLKVADRSGNPGSESGTDEAVGTEVESNETESQGDEEVNRQKGKEVKGQRGKEAKRQKVERSLEVEATGNGNKLTLEGMDSDSGDFSPVFAPDFSAKTGESFSQYRKVYLAAQQELAEAISNEQIPVRYKQQVKDYFKGIAPNE